MSIKYIFVTNVVMSPPLGYHLKFYMAKCNLGEVRLEQMLVSGILGRSCSLGSHTRFCKAYVFCVRTRSCFECRLCLWRAFYSLTSLLLVLVSRWTGKNFHWSYQFWRGPRACRSHGCHGYLRAPSLRHLNSQARQNMATIPKNARSCMRIRFWVTAPHNDKSGCSRMR